MKLKGNLINVHGVGIEMVLASMIINEVYCEFGFECVITSICDGYHSDKSLHYTGDAIDFRRYYGDFQKVVDEIDRRLNADYDVVLEDDHLHVEYQPRKR